MNERISLESYDTVPYPSVPFIQSHPARLSAVARLFAMNPSPPSAEAPRVLELGCASGENLIPLALNHPRGEFVGIDLSRRQIAAGREMAARMGVGNVRLEHGDILDFPAEEGEFDFIIAHGVYSWVPMPVRDGMLALMRRHLAANGLAYISYNTNPGWRMRGIARDAMLHHIHRFKDPKERLEQAVAIVGFLASSIPENIVAYRKVFADAVEAGKDPASRNARIFHDYISDVNEPVYFDRFNAHVREHGLRYLGEVEVDEMLLHHFPPEVSEALKNLGSHLEAREQYIDFLRNRVFRQSILRHAESTSAPAPQRDRVPELCLTGQFHFEDPDHDIASTSPAVFRDVRGTEASMDHPLSKAALKHLTAAFPQAVPYVELEEAARRMVAAGPRVIQSGSEFERDRTKLLDDLFQASCAGMIELSTVATPVCRTPGERPQAFPWAAYQAATGGMITNVRHFAVEVNDLSRRLLVLMDGTRDHEALVTDLTEIVVREGMAVLDDGKRIEGRGNIRASLSAGMADNIGALTRAGMLIG